MRIIAFLLFTLSALGQEITDLGVITAHRGILLEKCTNRVDFLQFKIELIAQRWPSNKFEFTTTNEMLTLENFSAMPPGPCIMGVRSVCLDADESSIALFRVDVRRDPPKAPGAHPVQIGGLIRRNTTEAMLKSRIRNLTNNAPVPPTPPGMIAPKQMQARAEPLPGGSVKTYSDYMIEMQNFYARKRRSD